MIRKTIILVTLLLGVMALVLVLNPPTQTQADTSFLLQKYTFSNGGGLLQGGNYALYGVIGQPSVVGELTSSNFRLQAGYLAGSSVKAERYIFLPLVVK